MKTLLEKTKRELEIRKYSLQTKKTYLRLLTNYFQFKKVNLEKFEEENIKNFLQILVRKNSSSSLINQAINAIQFFYREVIHTPRKVHFRYAKKPQKLPVVLTHNEIEKILENISNGKHRLIISLSYGSGLRISEARDLKVQDLDFENLTIHPKGAKGGKDRLTVFPEKLKTHLQNQIAGKNSDEFIFESNRGGKLSERSLQKVFKQALQRSEIRKAATFHSLRHSFATHLLENGTDVRYVQELLGHKNIRTTQIYTRVTNPKLRNIKSPL